MNLYNLIELLAEDLGREYQHWHHYLTASTNVEGFHREELSEFFAEQAASEMQHVMQFRNLIMGICARRKMAIPFHEISITVFEDDFTGEPEVKNQVSACALLNHALDMEDLVVSNYVQRIKDACEVQELGGEDEIDAKYIELFLEDQLTDSRADADHLRKMLKSH